jgi:hypothetical protein
VAVVVPPTATEGCARATERVAIGGGPVTPPPELQPIVTRQNAIAVRMRSGSGTPLGLPGPAEGRELNMEANQGCTSKAAADYRPGAVAVAGFHQSGLNYSAPGGAPGGLLPGGGPPGPIGRDIPR